MHAQPNEVRIVGLGKCRRKLYGSWTEGEPRLLDGAMTMNFSGRIVRRIMRTVQFPSKQWRAIQRGYTSSLAWRLGTAKSPTEQSPQNPLLEFFENRKEGRGIWKWNHYFEIYHRHFQRFRGQEVHVLEIGIYSGGSLEMWRDYFGPKAIIYGVDIEPSCRVYANDRTKIFIGDQANRSFWRTFRNEVPALDIVIDDGGHQLEQQIVSTEELFPFLRPGGVYVCEDVLGAYNEFASYVQGLTHRLNDYVGVIASEDDNERRIVYGCTPFQAAVNSVHFYPFVSVLERNETPVNELRARKHGTQWQPFLK